MPHIDFKNDLPGIRSAMTYIPETVAAIDGMEEILLRRNEGHAHAERKLIEMYVPYLNNCFYCYSSQTEIACIYLYNNRQFVKQIKKRLFQNRYV